MPVSTSTPDPHAANVYELAFAQLLKESGCTVRRYRENTLTGVAFTNDDDWGIEVPRPTTARRFGTCAHEIGHQMLHRHNSKPRWLEEWEAWDYALKQFVRFDLPGAEAAMKDAAKCLRYAAKKANRRIKKPETAQAILDTFPEWVWADERA